MKIAILTPGILPVPTVKGGAVEMLTEYLLLTNEKNQEHDISLFGIDDDKITPTLLSSYQKTNFFLLKQQSFITRLKRLIYSKTHKEIYYNPYLEYYIWQALKKIKNGNYDLLLIENRPHAALLAAEALDIPIVLHLHNDTLDQHTNNAKQIFDKCAKILTVSGYIKKQVDTILPGTNKVRVVYNGIDLSRFTAIKNMQKLDRSKFGLLPNDFVVVFTGRLDPIKGIKELLEAFLLLKDYPQIKLLLVGGSNYGNSTESEFIVEMKKLVASLQERVIFTGHLPYNSIPEILTLGDIGVIPSICEDALTLSSLEDMAVGLPLIVTRSGGIPEAVDENCAIIIEKDHDLSKNLAKEIINLYSHKNKREEMAKAAIERAKLFSKEVYTTNLFKQLTGK